MNKNDIKLIIIILICSLISIVFIINKEKSNNKVAKVYYNSKLVLEIDLSINNKKTYYVTGYNGKIKLITKKGKIKVDSENSKLHLCSKQGYIEHTYESIICLPNKIVIEIENNDKKIDTIVK